MKKYGSININLGELVVKRGFSKNKFCHEAEMQRSQLNRYIKNEVTRMDTDVLARICTTLNCQISDLLTYIPPKED